MTTPNEHSMPYCKRHNMRLLSGTLFASVVLNLFMVGVLAGLIPVAKQKSFRPMSLVVPHGEFLVDGMTHYLDQSDAKIFRDAVKSRDAALREAHEHVRETTKDIASVFEQDPPDPTALQTALDHWGEAKGNVESIVKDIIKEVDAKLSPDGRHRLAELTR